MDSWQKQVMDNDFTSLSVTKWDNKAFDMLLREGITFGECTKKEVVLFITYLINKSLTEAEMLSRENSSIVLQCKLYSKPVGNKAIQEALSGMAFEQAHFAVVVAPNGFTRSAKQLAKRTGVFLLSEQELSLLEKCVSR